MGIPINENSMTTREMVAEADEKVTREEKLRLQSRNE